MQLIPKRRTPVVHALRVALVSLLGTLVVHADVRTWRDQQTDTAVDAELLKVEGEIITLRMSDGKTFTYPMSRFHPDDQTYAKEFAERQTEDEKERMADPKNAPDAPPEVRLALRADVTEQSKHGDSERTGDKDLKGKRRSTSTHFDVRLSNARSGPEMKNIAVVYTIYTRKRASDSNDKASNATTYSREEGTENLETLAPGKTEVIATSAITTTDFTAPYEKDKKKYEKRQSEEVVGILVDVLVDGAKVTTIEQPPGLLRTVEKRK